jgi:hypothetical protein
MSVLKIPAVIVRLKITTIYSAGRLYGWIKKDKILPATLVARAETPRAMNLKFFR